jgi:hypothetical protein
MLQFESFHHIPDYINIGKSCTSCQNKRQGELIDASYLNLRITRRDDVFEEQEPTIDIYTYMYICPVYLFISILHFKLLQHDLHVKIFNLFYPLLKPLKPCILCVCF